MKIGFQKALSAIIDGNITTLIAAAVLGFMGSGTVRGFAQTLALGIVVSMFTALFVTRSLMNAFYALGIRDEKFYGRAKERKTINSRMDGAITGRSLTGKIPIRLSVKFAAVHGILWFIT